MIHDQTCTFILDPKKQLLSSNNVPRYVFNLMTYNIYLLNNHIKYCMQPRVFTIFTNPKTKHLFLINGDQPYIKKFRVSSS